MSMQALNSQDRAAYTTWRRNLFMFWGFVVAVVTVAGTILALDSTSDDGAANRNGPAFRDVPVDVERFFSRVAGTNLRSTTPFWTK